MTGGRSGRATVDRAVSIGGGHGAARTLRALASIADEVTAVVTVADDGGSSGRLRRDLDVLPPGDLRMALTALARDDELRQIVDFRFERGELVGHSLGNLMMVALQELSEGDVIVALDRMARLLGVPGRVLPCTTSAVTLHARTAVREITGQAAVAATAQLQRVWLEPSAAAATEVLAAIAEAQLIVLGPGSLYTSLLPNLLVRGMTDAINEADGTVVLVANLREQVGETEGMDLIAHLDALDEHLGRLKVDVIAVHQGSRPSAGVPLVADAGMIEQLRSRVAHVEVADLLDGEDGHDPVALAALLARSLST